MSGSQLDGQRERLFARYGRLFSRGDVIFREAEPGAELYVIQEGRVRILKTIHSREKSLAILRPGDFFGEMAILNGHTRSATAMAVDECKLLVFDNDTFDALITGHVGITTRLIRQLAARLREADHQIENMMLRDSKSRIVNSLVKLAREGRQGNTPQVALRTTPLELSSKVGLDVDTVKQGIFELRDAGLLMVEPGRLVVRNLAELETLHRSLGEADGASSTSLRTP